MKAFLHCTLFLTSVLMTAELQAGPVISEFLASNENGLTDEDGDSSDWIEIHNPDNTPVDLDGWTLTDDATVSAKWTFPSVTLAAGERLVVFASKKDRAPTGAGAELHTNFSLSAQGEYLALIQPGESIIGTEFDPYPVQKTDISYGVSSSTTQHIDKASALKYTLTTPPNDAEGDAWNEDDFDAASWTPSDSSQTYQAAIGYDNRSEYPIDTIVPSGTTELWVRYPFQLTDTSAVNGLTLNTRQDDGFEAYINGSLVYSINATPPVQSGESSGFAAVDLSAHLTALHTGNNVLAFRLLNSSTTSSDLFLSPELSTTGTEAGFSYSKTPTPGTANDGHLFSSFVKDTKFTIGRGFFNTVFTETITCATLGSSIVYTTDGSLPTLGHGTQVPSASASTPGNATLNITTSTILRVAAFLPNALPSNTDTNTYLFTSDVVSQPAAPTGWPASPVNGQVLDYAMDTPSAIGSNSPEIKAALESIPSISVVTAQNNLLDTSTGIYVNPGNHGDAWERPASVEMLLPPGYTSPDDHIEGFHSPCGLRIRGGFSRTKNNAKHSFRLFFRSEYGNKDLDFPLFGKEGTDSFRRIDFRTAQNYAWSLASSNPAEKNTFIRDVFNRDAQRDIRQPYTRSRYFHLYLNGLYWGLYMTEERADDHYGESYLGGDNSQYDVVKSSGSSGGYRTEATGGELLGGDWETTWNLTKSVRDTTENNNNAYFQLQGRDSSGNVNTSLPKYLEVNQLIDYMLVIFYVGSADSPLTLGGAASNNWYGMRNRVSNRHGFQFFVHDTEHSMDASNRTDVTGPFSLGKDDATNRSNPQFMHEYLANNAEYRLSFADRTHAAFHNAGALTPTETINRINTRASTIDTAIIAESARWGDQRGGAPYKRSHWLTAVAGMKSWMNNRETTVISQLRIGNLYPDTDAPAFNQHGGVITTGFQLTISNPNNQGTIYFTTDGSDPRAVGGTVLGTSYTGAITLNVATTVKARVLNGIEWSALNEAEFTLGATASSSNLVVSEFSYNAAPSTPDGLDGDDFDFIEIMNIGAEKIDLTTLRLDLGVLFDFSTIAVDRRTLAPGDRAIIAEDSTAFQSRYGNAPTLLGQWSGQLSNGGETIHLSLDDGTLVQEFTYNDKLPWPTCADGDGYSLVLIDPTSTPNHNNPENWRCSVQSNGNPGETDTLPAFAGNSQADLDGDGLKALLEHFLGSSDNQALDGPDRYHNSTVSVTDGTTGATSQHLTITFKRQLGTDDLRYQIEVSTSLKADSWQSGSTQVKKISDTHHGDGTSTEVWRTIAPISPSGKLFLRLKVTQP